MQEYAQTFGTKLDPLEREPNLCDFYTPSDNKQDYETAFIIAGTAVLGLVVYQIVD